MIDVETIKEALNRNEIQTVVSTRALEIDIAIKNWVENRKKYPDTYLQEAGRSVFSLPKSILDKAALASGSNLKILGVFFEQRVRVENSEGKSIPLSVLLGERMWPPAYEESPTTLTPDQYIEFLLAAKILNILTSVKETINLSSKILEDKYKRPLTAYGKLMKSYEIVEKAFKAEPELVGVLYDMKILDYETLKDFGEKTRVYEVQTKLEKQDAKVRIETSAFNSDPDNKIYYIKYQVVFSYDIPLKVKILEKTLGLITSQGMHVIKVKSSDVYKTVETLTEIGHIKEIVGSHLDLNLSRIRDVAEAQKVDLEETIRITASL